jgi:hypothetical protein
MQNLRVILNDQLEVMAALHAGDGAGHRGVEATKQKILMTYWWPHLSRMVEQFVKSCDPCQRSQRQKYRERLTSDVPPPLLFMKWFWDINFYAVGVCVPWNLWLGKVAGGDYSEVEKGAGIGEIHCGRNNTEVWVHDGVCD